MGDWLGVNGEAIYGTRRWRVTHEGPLVPTYDSRLDKDWRWTVRDRIPMVYYTRKGDILYALCLAWPGRTVALTAPTPSPRTQVSLLGFGPVTWKAAERGMILVLPPLSPTELPCRHAWVLRLTGLNNVE